MKIQATHIPYRNTNSFSNLVIDYLNNSDKLETFISKFPSIENIANQIIHKKENYTYRLQLCEALNTQYKDVLISDEVDKNLKLLADSNTFTICTAHQPNIFTGYLYFVYKIVHAIRLANECRQQFPNYNFVPIYYMGSEDNDIDEIGVFHYNKQTFHWAPNQKGACGRMHTKELADIVVEIKKTLNDENVDEHYLIQVLESAYNGINTLAQATRIIVNSLFGSYGLLVVDGDDRLLKKSMISVFRNEILNQVSNPIVTHTTNQISLNYKVQANPRSINLFYLKDNLRERIEQDGEQWQVMNTDIRFDKSEIEIEIQNSPQNFSPNVILRPLYQETILPNVAFVGGGGELAYWIELKDLFEHFHITYPILFLRNSVQWITSKTFSNIKKMKLDFASLFLAKEEIFKLFIRESDEMKSLELNMNQIANHFNEIKNLGNQVSASLGQSTEAHIAKIGRIELRLKQKFKAHLKKKESQTFDRIETIKDHISPNGNLQERYDNFLSIYKIFGRNMFEILLQYQQPFGKEFLILTIEE